MKQDKKRSARYLKAQKLVDQNKIYSISEAADLIKKTSFVKFDAAVEVHFNLGIDPSKSEQLVRGTVVMPNSLGKSRTIAAIVPADKVKEAKDAGADVVGSEELIEEIKKTQKLNFDILVSTPDMMKLLAPLAKFLGPRGLMPSPKNETVTSNIAKTIKELKTGKLSFKNDDTGNVHAVIGRVSLDSNKLTENFNTIKEAILKNKPSASKGVYVKGITLTSTMGPGIRVA